jgi:hypothetical protein
MNEIITLEEAKEKGLKKYFTGKPCKHGHISERYVLDKTCCMCRYHMHRKYQLEHSEELKKYHQDYSIKNEHKLKEDSKDYWDRNRDILIEKKRKQYEENREIVLAQQEVYRSKNREKVSASIKASKEKNPAKYLTLAVKRRRLTAQAIPTWYDEGEENKFHFKRMELTTTTGIEHEVDHIVPINSPYVCGLHWHGNMQVITKLENRTKGNLVWPDMPDTSDPELRALVKAYKASCKD